jgi:hypothetical protein
VMQTTRNSAVFSGVRVPSQEMWVVVASDDMAGRI